MKTDDGRNGPKHVVYYHPLLNIILDIVVLLADTYTYCLGFSFAGGSRKQGQG